MFPETVELNLEEELPEIWHVNVHGGVPLALDPIGPAKLDPAHDKHRDQGAVLRVPCADRFEVGLASRVMHTPPGTSRGWSSMGANLQRSGQLWLGGRPSKYALDRRTWE